MQTPPSGAWLRALSGLFAALALMTLAACGGGSGAPNNPFAAPLPLTVTPANLFVVAGVPATLAVTGGTAPYSASSNNPNVLPVAQSVVNGTIPLLASGVAAAATVAITVTDSRGNVVVTTVTVQPGSLAIVPPTAVIFSGVTATLTVAGGIPPYRVFSSNAGVLPVTEAVPGNVIVLVAANVQANTDVTLTVMDSVGQSTTAAITVSPAPLLNSLTITPNFADCGTNAICSGQSGTARVALTGPGGGPLSGRQVKFDVISGPFGIVPPGAGPVVSTLTVVSDGLGNATVIIKANVDAPTQFAQLRATDLTSGQQLTGSFLIQQVTDGSQILSIVPDEATIIGPSTGKCSTGIRVDYFIYGGTPPYHVSSTFPSAVTIPNPTVNASGGFFEAITNGTCVNPLTFTIVDATGRQTTATLINQEGTGAAPPSTLAVSPDSYTTTCLGKTFPFVITGGTPPYNVLSGTGTIIPQVVNATGQSFTVTGLTGIGTVKPLITDSGTPAQQVSATINCQ